MRKTETKYPVILVHGIILRDSRIYRSFGPTEKFLRQNGYRVFTAPTDGFGTIESNAEQLGEFIKRVLAEEKAEKVNLIAHSKGGLDSKYAIQSLGLEDCVASLTTISTPHYGSPVASFIYRFPKWILKIIAFFINTWYRIFGDKHPNSLKVCEQLQQCDEIAKISFAQKVYCQSYAAKLDKRNIIMCVPSFVLKKMGYPENDGLVTLQSSEFENYKGLCLEESVSHAEIAGFVFRKKKRKKVLGFYLNVLEDLADRGY